MVVVEELPGEPVSYEVPRPQPGGVLVWKGAWESPCFTSSFANASVLELY